MESTQNMELERWKIGSFVVITILYNQNCLCQSIICLRRTVESEHL